MGEGGSGGAGVVTRGEGLGGGLGGVLRRLGALCIPIHVCIIASNHVWIIAANYTCNSEA